jgi:hypothetical protein
VVDVPSAGKVMGLARELAMSRGWRRRLAKNAASARAPGMGMAIHFMSDTRRRQEA